MDVLREQGTEKQPLQGDRLMWAHQIHLAQCAIGFHGAVPAGYLVRSLARIGIIVGTGAACCSRNTTAPNTLLAMGIEPAAAGSSIRASFCRYSTWDEAEALIAALRRIVPSWRHDRRGRFVRCKSVPHRSVPCGCGELSPNTRPLAVG
jgi:hypothetical protein